jgi:hypothetical protein
LQTFRVKINVSTAAESFEAWREKDKDDLVLATALPLWYSERALRQFWVRYAEGDARGPVPAGAHPPPPDDGHGEWEWTAGGWTRAVSGLAGQQNGADWTADKPGPGWRRVFNGRR